MAENHTVNCDASRGGRGKSLLEREGGESVYTRQHLHPAEQIELRPRVLVLGMVRYKLYLGGTHKRYLDTEQQSCCLSTGLPVLFPINLCKHRETTQAGQCRDNNFVVPCLDNA